MKTLTTSAAGFSLIELLIVVAIIGILASITVPLYNSYTTRAVNSAAQTDLRNLKSAMESQIMQTVKNTHSCSDIICQHS